MIFQPMPAMTAEQDAALRADIQNHGVLVPIVVDQYGRILDGHNRSRIAAELGVECPRDVRPVSDDIEAGDLAVTLNCARRHLTRDQQREVIAAEIARKPDDSNRAIARRVGCDHKTVAAVRKPKGGEIPQMSREEAEELTAKIAKKFWAISDDLYAVCVAGISNAMPAGDIVLALVRARSTFDMAPDPETYAEYARLLFDPMITYVSDPKSTAYWAPSWEHPTFLPLTEEYRQMLLERIAAYSFPAHQEAHE